MASKWIAEKMGDMVEDAVKKALGMDDDKDKDKDEGGIFSKIFNRDDDEDEKKKRRRSSEKDDDDDKESFFSKIFDKDDDDKKKDSKSGFSGLFSELEGAASAGHGGGAEERGGAEDRGGAEGRGGATTVQVNDGDLFDDLMNVAEETAGNK